MNLHVPDRTFRALEEAEAQLRRDRAAHPDLVLRIIPHEPVLWRYDRRQL